MPQVIGIHPVLAAEPVHLIELRLDVDGSEVDWTSFTQEIPNQDRSFWQVPYDERPVPGRPGHWCFFFHYLDQGRPLSSFAGELSLPSETPVPAHLAFVRYEEP
jgi:hypothetical protein